MFVERVCRSIKYEEVYLNAYEPVSHARRSPPLFVSMTRVNLMRGTKPQERHDIRCSDNDPQGVVLANRQGYWNAGI